jgi:hypothetical protein
MIFASFHQGKEGLKKQPFSFLFLFFISVIRGWKPLLQI